MLAHVQANCIAPCLDVESLTQLPSNNETLFAPAEDACGTDPVTLLRTVRLVRCRALLCEARNTEERLQMSLPTAITHAVAEAFSCCAGGFRCPNALLSLGSRILKFSLHMP